MRRSKRNIERLDYAVLHSTGEKKDISNISELFENISIQDTTMDNLLIEIETLSEDISDFMDENPIQHIEYLEPSDIDRNLKKITDLRTSFRKTHLELRQLHSDYDNKYLAKLNTKLGEIKDYVTGANEARHKLRIKSYVNNQEGKDKIIRQINFLCDDIMRLINEVEREVSINVTKITDEDLTSRKEELSATRKKMQLISSKISQLLAVEEGSENSDVIKKRYEVLNSSLSRYEETLKKETETREINKELLFKESKLNIKILKFKGYDSSEDIYTFISNFEKVHAKTTPKRLMPDLLKNNLLEEPALSLVKSLDNIDDIWNRLKKAYGDPKIMLTKKLNQLLSLESLWKTRSNEKIADGISKVINIIKDLMRLASKHNIEAKLYNSDALEKIYKVMGDKRMTRWLNEIYEEDLDGELLWKRLLKFLDRDLEIQQQKMQVFKNNDLKDTKIKERTHYTDDHQFKEAYSTTDVNQVCAICGERDHIQVDGPNGIKLIQYFTCKKFVQMTPQQRFNVLREKKLCFQCLYPHASSDDGKHREGKCQREFTCKHPLHSKYPRKKHVLVCNEHRDSEENVKLLQHFKERCILKQKSINLPDFAKDIKLSFLATAVVNQNHYYQEDDDIIHNKGIYQLQTIKIDGHYFNIFYDSGCGDFVSRKSAIDKIKSRAFQEFEGPVNIGGVGGIVTQTPHGIYTVQLDLRDNKIATMTGICLENITATFPSYPIIGKVQEDINNAYQQQCGDPSKLPKLPRSIGGDVDFMIGIKYLRYHPKQVFQLPSGLTIYESMFENADGGFGVIGGPHAVFTAIEKHFHLTTHRQSSYLCNQLQLFRQGFIVNPDVSMLGYKDNNNIKEEHEDIDNFESYSVRRIKLFTDVEETGSSISYRCKNCRCCKVCKNHDSSEEVSIKEEIEQEIINKSVVIDAVNRITTASLPFISNPENKLIPNKDLALKVYQQQIRKLNQNHKDKDDVLKSESKLQSLGYVDYVSNLSTKQQLMLQEATIKNFIPWRAVWKCSSVTTPCRVVFDASQSTRSGYSLNDLLAKGTNNMNKLQDIFIRWMCHKVAFHTDVQKMYNSVRLKEEDWCYQRYLWQSELDPLKPPQEKIIKTLIYGVKSSGNQAEFGLRQAAMISKHLYPKASDIICRDVYVDDCLSGEESLDLAKSRGDELEIITNRCGFTLKGISMSGEDPLECLTDDGKSIHVAGMKWWPKDDVLSFDINELCFAKKYRGKPIINDDSFKIPEKLTRRMCTSKVAEIYDLVGKMMPIVSSLKIDLHDLVQRKLDWDDKIPDSLRQIWISNFEMVQEIKHLRFKRAIVPTDAITLDVQTLDFGDASSIMACSAIYARFKRPNDQYSCQLIFSRSKILPDGISQPRAELTAALLNAHTGEVVKRSFATKHIGHIKLSDSQIVLCWLRNEEKPLKQWVRNRIIEIKRFTQLNDWFYVESSKMIADIGTRRGCKVKDVGPNSEWINGFHWMSHEVSKMPIINVTEIVMNKSISDESKKEMNDTTIYFNLNHNEILRRYEFSKYLIDPNKFSFHVIIRIMGYVYKFINLLRQKKRILTKEINLNDNEIQLAKNYFYKKGTMEVKQFNKAKHYTKFTEEKDDILHYTGRILPSDEISITGKFTAAMLDLCSTTFCVPVLDRFSPISYSIVNDVHWYDKNVSHRGIETVWREVLKSVFIIEGRAIVKLFRKTCQRCRYLNKKLIEVSMGPLSQCNITIAPAFYMTQIDLAGPFQSYSAHHKRTTVKVWMAVFCCCTTSAVNIKIMDSYNSASFIQAVIRMACEVGYPKKLFPDEGSQLLKSCSEMNFNYTDIKNKLYSDVKMEFEACPVGAHNIHGRVERKIKEIKKSISISFENHRLSLLQWETVAAEIANCINDMPLALGSAVSDFEAIDLITPNRLRLGRNNNRSPDGVMEVTNDPTRFFKSNTRIFESWFEIWIQSHLPLLIYQPKWFKISHNLKKDDIILFKKHDSSLKSKYQYGIVDSVSIGRDGIVRKAVVKYKNTEENQFRYTNRSARDLVVIHAHDEIDIIFQLNDMAAKVDLQFQNLSNH